MDPVIDVQHLRHRYGGKLALDDVSFQIAPGRVFGLVGENGAGKTTLIKHLLGTLCPEDGQVRVFGIAPTSDPPAVLARLGYLSEDRDLPQWMRVRELMQYTRAFYPNWDPEYAEVLRERFRLNPNSRVKSLSRGEKARAGLLVALAHRPDVLLLDEPSSGLDPVSRHEILGAIVRSVAEEGRTVVFSSHLLEEVERVADDIAMLHEGRLAFLASMEDLRDAHRQFIVEFPTAVPGFPDVPGRLHAYGEGREWAVVCYGESERMRGELQTLGARIVEESIPSLDAIFVAHVTGGKAAS